MLALRNFGVTCSKFKSIRFIYKRYSIKVGLLGVPFDKGQRRKGVCQGPAVIRNAGIIKDLEELGCDVKDFGDVSYNEMEGLETIDNFKALEHVASCHKKVSETVTGIIAEGRVCLTLGGDHSVGIGSIDGHIKAKNDIALLWVDAHADINTAATSPSGNVHGMPVALLVKELSDYWPYIPGMDWQQPRLSIRNVAYIGLREIDGYERLIIDKYGIVAYGMEDIERYGIHEVITTALKKIDPRGNRSIHVSYDIDSLDSLEAPCTGTSVRGGLSLREGVHLMEEVFRTNRLSAFDLVEVNPALGNERDLKITLEAATAIIKAAFGHNRSGLAPRNIHDLPHDPSWVHNTWGKK